jgi:DNA-binding CsgD family transcriptional regulator
VFSQIGMQFRTRLSIARFAAMASESRRRAWAVLNANLVALGAALVSQLLEGPNPQNGSRVPILFLIGAAFVLSRWLGMHAGLRSAVIVLDAIGTVVFLSVAGAPSSPFYFFALAGAWWAGHLRPPHGAMLFGVIFVGVYLVMVMPAAIARHAAPEAFEDLVALIIVASLTDFYLALDRRAIEMSRAMRAMALSPQDLTFRRHVAALLEAPELPVDAVLAGAQFGLTAIQTELLALLMVGSTSPQMAEALSISEAAVRYRLTRLYRTLKVHGRTEAVARARAMGLDWLAEASAHQTTND